MPRLLVHPHTHDLLPLLLDPEDQARVSGYKIFIMVRKGYPGVYIRPGAAEMREHGFASSGAQVLARFLLGLHKGDPIVIDHINRNPLDNRRENLRRSTTTANVVNSTLSSANTSGFKGVSWSKAKGRWEASVQSRHAPTHRARFQEIEDAARWYDAKVREVHGPTASTNASLGLL